MPKKDSRTQLLDDIIHSVSRKKDVVKPLILDLDSANASVKQTVVTHHPVPRDAGPGTHTLMEKLFKPLIRRKSTISRKKKLNNQKLWDLFIYNLATSFARGVGILLGISVTLAISLLIITDLMGLARVQKITGVIINWLRLALS